MKLVVFVLLMTIAHRSLAVEYTLKSGEEITINPGSLYYALHKGGLDVLINFFHGFCGSDVCNVDLNESFDLIYKVNNVTECHGTNGTQQWQGPLNVGQGSGEFVKNINGITENTTFTLNCSRNFGQDELLKYDFFDASGVIKQMGFTDMYSVIAVLVGTEIKIIPFDRLSKKMNLSYQKTFGNNKYMVFMISDQPATSFNDFVMMMNELDPSCYSVGEATGDVPTVKLSDLKEKGVCHKDLSKSFYFSYALFEKNAK